MYRAETEILNAEQEELHHETSFAVCPSSIFCMSKTFFEAENDLGGQNHLSRYLYHVYGINHQPPL